MISIIRRELVWRREFAHLRDSYFIYPNYFREHEDKIINPLVKSLNNAIVRAMKRRYVGDYKDNEKELCDPLLFFKDFNKFYPLDCYRTRSPIHPGVRIYDLSDKFTNICLCLENVPKSIDFNLISIASYDAKEDTPWTVGDQERMVETLDYLLVRHNKLLDFLEVEEKIKRKKKLLKVLIKKYSRHLGSEYEYYRTKPSERYYETNIEEPWKRGERVMLPPPLYGRTKTGLERLAQTIEELKEIENRERNTEETELERMEREDCSCEF